MGQFSLSKAKKQQAKLQFVAAKPRHERFWCSLVSSVACWCVSGGVKSYITHSLDHFSKCSICWTSCWVLLEACGTERCVSATVVLVVHSVALLCTSCAFALAVCVGLFLLHYYRCYEIAYSLLLALTYLNGVFSIYFQHGWHLDFTASDTVQTDFFFHAHKTNQQSLIQPRRKKKKKSCAYRKQQRSLKTSDFCVTLEYYLLHVSSDVLFCSLYKISSFSSPLKGDWQPIVLRLK